MLNEETTGGGSGRDQPAAVACVFGQQPLQSSVSERLVVIGRRAERYDLIPHTWTERERERDCDSE